MRKPSALFWWVSLYFIFFVAFVSFSFRAVSTFKKSKLENKAASSVIAGLDNKLNRILERFGSIEIHFGIASWYGGPFHGRKTASGETYNMNSMTAAHRDLRFGTQVLIKNLHNGKFCVARINDRGPFLDNRTLDVSSACAKELGIERPGTAAIAYMILNPMRGYIFERLSGE